MPLAEHFAGPPHWEWFILGYFFLAGLTGGSYALATMLRLWGQPADEAAARLGFYIAFVAVILCPILLTVDLGQPVRFWHMMVNTTPGTSALNFKYWSPMSVGVWALLVYGVFATVSFLEVLIKDKVISSPGAASLAGLLDGAFGRAFNGLGSVLGLFIASYTGILLSVSNQPVWSDTWSLGGLFLASGLSGSAALITLLMARRPEAALTEERLHRADGYFGLLELALIALFLVTLTLAGTVGQTLGMPWTLLWVLVLASLVPPLAGLARAPLALAGAGVHSGQLAASRPAAAAAWVPLLVLVGVLALRAVVIFSAQA
jgi:formate-dependent nitrite reductase membrane component NrfD